MQTTFFLLENNGLGDVSINPVAGDLTDNYDPRSKTLNLSESVYGSDTVSAVSVACHEAGHAIQHSKGYFPLKFRNAIVPVVRFSSGISWFLIIGGILLMRAQPASSHTGLMLMDIGIIAFTAVFVFHLITLPVEFDYGRTVKKGEKGIRIIAPAPFKVKQEMKRLDPKTNMPVIGADGNALTEEKEITIPAYKVVSVWPQPTKSLDTLSVIPT